jgi:hypothetical protein
MWLIKNNLTNTTITVKIMIVLILTVRSLVKRNQKGSNNTDDICIEAANAIRTKKRTFFLMA